MAKADPFKQRGFPFYEHEPSERDFAAALRDARFDVQYLWNCCTYTDPAPTTTHLGFSEHVFKAGP